MLELDGVTSRYGPVTALQDVDLIAEQGRITAVLGANGAGKTTLLRTISGLHRPDSGRIRFDGQDITKRSADAMTRGGLAHVPEGRGVITELTVEENLRLGALGRSTHRDAVRMDEVVDLFPILGDRSNALAHTLSGGERQMLVIARSLLATPKMLLLDEPSLGLAPRIVAQIFAIVRRLVEEQGLSVLLVEQNARSALSIADVGIVLGLGKVVAQDDAQVLAADENLRHAYLGY
ncbi:ABC transporter ATP-binding protein [Janibacter alkaliphilus]|uniref:Branched-chain amino acid transport system ATP-binding protein n=1 Tax=Janibacter alkaliphilus TaxID=1069963 RepID=A0A852XGK0_9MICO|nr:branched-chain amino acid transport system ATP-binding protein [Janibacter alkaliphilus]